MTLTWGMPGFMCGFSPQPANISARTPPEKASPETRLGENRIETPA
jgi:hypothetical protein